MAFLSNIIFGILLFSGLGFFMFNVKKLVRNIKLGRKTEVFNHKIQRLNNMIRIALGQSKMVKRPIAGLMHIVVYLGFIIINIEVLEIVIDGLLGTHRVFYPMIGNTAYGLLIGIFEVLAFLVFVAVTVFWIRRNVIKLKRFWNPEMKGWPRNDANFILYFEMILMVLFLVMNTTDLRFQELATGNIVSQFLTPLFSNLDIGTIHIIERSAWWFHIVGILAFLNYLYYSKHLHILLAFPNTYFGRVTLNGKFENLEAVTREVKLMMDPEADPYATPPEGEDIEDPQTFGAKDVQDLTWVQLMSAYTCTECGRCTSECPASQTGKKLSPRKIMMDTRDRLEEIGKNIDKNKTYVPDGKQLLGDYISHEEIWACTTCNACVEACPISIDPLSIIMNMRQYLVMEESAAPNELNIAMTNIENNGAPWPYNQMDRLNWKDE